MSLKTLAIATVLYFALSVTWAAESGWKVAEWKDEMTDEPRRVALVTAGSGHFVSVRREQDRRVWVLFSLPKAGGEILATRRAPMIRIDQNKMHDFEGSRYLTAEKLVDAYKWTPRGVQVLVWHGIEAQGSSVFIDELLAGETMRVRYFTLGGEAKDVVFTLSGARNSVGSVLGLSR